MITLPGPEQAAKFKRFLTTMCCHTKGKWAGHKFVMLPWQENVIDKTFGTLRDDGRRQYRIVYVEIPKKNGKSELAAPFALYMLGYDGEYGAEVYSAAADREQASLVYHVACEMVRQNKTFEKRFQLIDSKKRIVDMRTNSFYQVLSAEAYTKHGINPSCIIFDELHAQPNDELWNILTSGTDYAREQQLILVLTTAGVYDPESIWWRIRSKAIRIAEGVVEDPTFLPILYIADRDHDDPDDEEVWKRVNPSIGQIFTLDKIREDYQIAKQNPTEWNNFLRFRLNIPAAEVSRFVMPEIWIKNGGKVDEEDLAGRTCYSGLDLSATTDLSALVHIFPPQSEDDKFKVLCRFWIPEEGLLKRKRRDSVPYDVWVQCGFITATPGDVIDYGFILKQIDEDTKKFDLKELAFDRWGSQKLITDLQDMGFEEEKKQYAQRHLIQFGQGFASMSSPTKELEKMLLACVFNHGDNPVLTWMSTNMVVRKDPSGNLKPDKEKSIERIDGMVALIMALDRVMRNGSESSVYNERGLMIL